ncbi:MAG: hypothetical protein IPH69_06300 [Bacteroidales bacterium]|nr:hypothetical protein [Bacteroidales bacterium]
MKYFFFLLLLLASFNLSGQTDSLEKAVLHNKLLSKEITDAGYSKTMEQWVELINRVKYPDLPLDQNGVVHYVFINEFKGFDREKLMNRTREWLAINYGFLPGDMYFNEKEGKIILRNSLSLIYSYSCIFTSVISIKDEKIKFEMISLVYEAFYKGDMSADRPDKTVSFSISDVYPVILKKSSEWPLNLTLFKATNKLFDTEIKNLNDYITSYDNSNVF